MLNQVQVSNKLRSLIKRAYSEAAKSQGHHKLRAVAINGDRILSKSHNSYDNGAHAEVRTVNKVAHDMQDSIDVVIVVRMRKTTVNKMGLAKPCPKCSAYLAEMGVKKVIYSHNDGSFYEMDI